MTAKQEIIYEIDSLPPDLLNEILAFIKSVKKRVMSKKKIPTFDLGGQCDKMDIRKKAYE